MENIKKFIEEGEKEFEEKFKAQQRVWVTVGDDISKLLDIHIIKDWHSSRQISLIKMIVEMIDGKMGTIPERVVNERLVNLKNQLLSSLVNGEK